jgi:protein TonB
MPELVLIRTRHDVLPERLALLRAGRRWPVVASVLAASAHAALAYSLSRAAPPARYVVAPEPIEVVPIDSPAPPPPPPPPPPPAPEPPPREAPPPSTPAAAPPPAAAAAALTHTAEPEQPVDFSDQLVTGTAAIYQGGTTASGSAKPAARAARAEAGPAASGAGRAPSSGVGTLDRSRPASVLGGLDWRCPFPEEADVAGVDRALAKIRVDIDAAGNVRNVVVVHDPGHGFGRAAERCARGKRFDAALDRNGRAIATQVAVGVRFVR